MNAVSNPGKMPEAFKNWSLNEIAMFDICMWKYGNRFDMFSHFVNTKSVKQLIDFYNFWKHSVNHEHWKQAMVQNGHIE